jgi:hypothetical protein
MLVASKPRRRCLQRKNPGAVCQYRREGPQRTGRKPHFEQIRSVLPQITDIVSSREDFSVGLDAVSCTATNKLLFDDLLSAGEPW